MDSGSRGKAHFYIDATQRMLAHALTHVPYARHIYRQKRKHLRSRTAHVSAERCTEVHRIELW